MTKQFSAQIDHLLDSARQLTTDNEALHTELITLVEALPDDVDTFTLFSSRLNDA